MAPIDIYVNRQLDGITFSLSPTARKEITRVFEEPIEAGSVFVSYNTQADYKVYLNKVENFILPVLLGFDYEKIGQIGKVNFIDPKTNDLLFSIR